jgi:serine/threonine-protein kinase
MADVYMATDDMLDRRVAIKILSERFSHDPEIRARFTREARIAARLSNERYVVTIFDVAEVAGRPAIVMEYLPGGTLADRMRQGRIAPALALTWLEQAARALDAAHAAGVVHRDVKPANLMISADGDIHVTDFGIARIAGDASLTSVGTVLGTSGYMSPEQATGGRATAASDRYALAVVAFESLTGRRPYTAETFAEEAAAHATAPIPAATSVDRSLPPAIDAVLTRGLAKDPDARYRSCAEMVSALRTAFSENAGTTMRAAQPVAPPVTAVGTAPSPGAARLHRSSRRPLLVAGLALLALLGVAVAVLATRGGDEKASARTVVRTQTVRGQTQLRTVTVQAPAPTQPTEESPAQSVQQSVTAPAAASDGASLNDQGFRLLQAGNAAAALPLLEQAVSKLQGSDSLAEAYASYNLALARYETGSCDGVKELLDRSQQVQGHRHEIDQLKHDVDRSCKGGPGGAGPKDHKRK